MKKISMILLLVFILTGLFACEKDKTPDEETLITDPIVIDDYDIESFDRLFNDEIEKTITIKITSDAWNNLDDEMIEYNQMFGNYRSDVYVMADFLYEDPSGQVEIEKVGFRTRGNLSRTRIQNDSGTLNLSNFKISFDEDFDNPLYSELKKRTAFDLEELDMKFNRNWDETYLSEKFALDLFNDFDVYAARTTLANFYVEIDDVSHYYGVYTLFEPIDQMFFEKRLAIEETEGNLYKSLWQQFNPHRFKAIIQS